MKNVLKIFQFALTHFLICILLLTKFIIKINLKFVFFFQHPSSLDVRKKTNRDETNLHIYVKQNVTRTYSHAHCIHFSLCYAYMPMPPHHIHFKYNKQEKENLV